MLEAFIWSVGTFLLFSFIHYAAKKKKPFKRAFLSILIGILVLTLVNILSGVTGVYIPVTRLSLIISAVGGIPGVSMLVLLSAL